MNSATNEAIRDSNGRFVPGHTNIGGRAPKAFEKGIVAALKERWSPETIAERIEEAYALAAKQQSARGMLAAIELACNYIYGKPTITIAPADTTRTDLLQQLLASDKPLLPEPDDILLLMHGNN